MSIISNVSNNELNVMSEQIFNRIALAEKSINLLLNYYEEDKDYNINHKPRNNSLIDPITVNYIHFITNYIKILHFEYKNITFNVNIYTKNYENISNYIYLIKLAIVCCLHDKKGFNEKVSLKIDLYLTELKKEIPEVPGALIKKEHAKSGYALFGDSIYICVYRREEWFKTLIQELFVAFTLDLVGEKINYKNILSNNFTIDDNFLINHSIVEFCARCFNAAIFLYFEKNCKELRLFKKEFKRMMNKEKNFAVSQTHKILTHFGLKYADLLKTEPTHEIEQSIACDLYGDESDLFCYFLITSLLFIHQTRFIQWINFEHNDFFRIKKSERELVILTYYIAQCSKDPKTLKIFEMKEKKHNQELDISTNSVSKNIKFSYHRI